jgi:hypothetical protein
MELAVKHESETTGPDGENHMPLRQEGADDLHGDVAAAGSCEEVVVHDQQDSVSTVVVQADEQSILDRADAILQCEACEDMASVDRGTRQLSLEAGPYIHSCSSLEQQEVDRTERNTHSSHVVLEESVRYSNESVAASTAGVGASGSEDLLLEKLSTRRPEQELLAEDECICGIHACTSTRASKKGLPKLEGSVRCE